MHIATIAQIAHRPDSLGWIHPAIPGRTLVRTVEGFFLEDPEGARISVAGNTSLPRDGWEPVAPLA